MSEVETQTWTYMGDRCCKDGALLNSWMDATGEVRCVHFRVKAPIGAQYEIEPTTEGRYRLGQYVGRDESPPKEWLLDANVHGTHSAKVKLEKRLARDATTFNGDALDAMTIGDIAKKISKTISRGDRRALVVAVLERLGL